MTGGLNRIGHYNAHRLINTLHIQLPFDNKCQVLVVLLSCGMDRMAWNTVGKNHTSKNWHAYLKGHTMHTSHSFTILGSRQKE